MEDGFGALAQLGERYNGIVEVSGSIPLGSTISSRVAGSDRPGEPPSRHLHRSESRPGAKL